MDDRVVVTGIGLVTSVGLDRESTWRAVRRGQACVRPLRGMAPLPDDWIWAAVVNWPRPLRGVAKTMAMAIRAGQEAMKDAHLDTAGVPPERIGCAMNAHMGYLDWYYDAKSGLRRQDDVKWPWYRQWLPNSACVEVARHFQLYGPRLAFSTACASSLVSLIGAVRAIRSGQCDVMLAGGSEAIDPLFAAGFQQMGVLAKTAPGGPRCRPFDEQRDGFVLGEGAGMLVLERLSHAAQRGARIYAEIVATTLLSEAHHLAGLDTTGETLQQLLHQTLDYVGIEPSQVAYVNAHGTGTPSNDLAEMRAYAKVFGRKCSQLYVSSTKSVLGHLINAAGVVESAITVLALRDGFLPPTMHIRRVDPNCRFHCLPRRGVSHPARFALKVAAAFGGHVGAILWRRWDEPLAQTHPPLARAA